MQEGKPDYVFEGITGSPKQWAYRNKMEFSFGDDHLDGPLTLGLHKKASTYDILTVDDCKIVHDLIYNCFKNRVDYFTEHPMPYYKENETYRLSPPPFGASFRDNRRDAGTSGDNQSGRM